MQEGDLEPEGAAPRQLVDDRRAFGHELRELALDVVDLEGDVVHPRSAAEEELANGRVGPERGEQLEPAAAQAERCDLDTLVEDRLSVLEASAEGALPGLDSLVEVADGEAEVVDTANVHGHPMLPRRLGRAAATCHARSVRRASFWSVALAAAALSGCASNASNGEAAKPAGQILGDVEAAAASAGSFRVSGSGESGGESVSLALRLLPARGAAAGRIALGGTAVELVALGARLYVRATAAFWRPFAPPAAAARLAGRWVVVPASGPAARELLPWTSAVALLRRLLGPRPDLVKGKFTSVRGMRAFTLEDRATGTTLSVAASGRPFPLALRGSRGGVAFLAWNQAASVTAPAGAVSYARLRG